MSGASRRLGPWPAYGVAAIAMGVAVATGGDRALALEDHWIRWVDAAAFLFVGAAGARTRALPGAARTLLFAAGALLAADELAMLHECLKAGPLAELHSARVRDVPVLVYGIAGLAVVGSLALAPRARPGVGPHLVASACGIAAVIASDALRVVPRSVEHVVEEGGELLAAVALGVALAAPGIPPTRLLTAWLAGAVVAGALTVGIVAARPTLCPGLAKARRLAEAPARAIQGSSPAPQARVTASWRTSAKRLAPIPAICWRDGVRPA